MNGVYNGTQGSVNIDTSRNRVTPNLEIVLNQMERYGESGYTWKDIAWTLDLHHGQASGALSNLHRMGLIFTTTTTRREGCQVYFLNKYSFLFKDDLIVREPVKTKTRLERDALMDLLAVVEGFIHDSEGDYNQTLMGGWWLEEMKEAVNKYRQIGGK